MIEKKLYDGHILRFPDGTTDDVINKVAKRETLARKSQQAPEKQGWLKDWLGAPQSVMDQPQSWGGIGLDTAAATASGVGRGAQALVETPEMLLKGVGRLRQEADYGFGNVPESQKIDPFDTFTGNIIDTGVEALGLTEARDYRSEGNLASTFAVGGEFLPAALGGPGGLTKNAAKMFGAGVASESAGKLLDETGYGDVARIGTALAAPSAMSAVRRPIKSIDEQTLADARFLKERGIGFTASDVTGSTSLGSIESRAGIGSEKINQFTQAVKNTFGVSDTSKNSKWLPELQSLLRSQMRDTTFGLKLNFNRLELAGISSSMKKFKDAKGLSAADKEPHLTLRNFRNRFLDTSKPITQDQYVSFRTDLSDLTRNKNDAISKAASDLVNILDKAVDRNLLQAGKSESVGVLSNARTKLRDLYAVETAVAKNADGTIKPEDLRSALLSQSKNQFLSGKRGELGQLADSGSRILSTPKYTSKGSDISQALREYSPYGLMGTAGMYFANKVGQTDALMAVTALTGVSVAGALKAVKTEMGQKYLINRALRSDQGNLGEDKIRALISTVANQNIKENEDQQ